MQLNNYIKNPSHPILQRTITGKISIKLMVLMD